MSIKRALDREQWKRENRGTAKQWREHQDQLTTESLSRHREVLLTLARRGGERGEASPMGILNDEEITEIIHLAERNQ